jgi:hypothetical protein
MGPRLYPVGGLKPKNEVSPRTTNGAAGSKVPLRANRECQEKVNKSSRISPDERRLRE